MAKILIVDDEPDIRSAIGRYFARSGHDVLRAGTGEEAVLLVQAERPAVVLLDLFLPDISGFEVLERTREERPVIIMITGHGDIAAAVHAMQAGAEGFLTKPVELAHLGAVVDRVGEKIPQVKTGNFFRERFDAAFRYANARASIVDPQCAHDVIERLRTQGSVADGEIEAQADHRTFLVIADNRVRRILVLPVVFDPRVKT